MRLIDADFLKEWVDEYLSVFKKYDKGTIKGFVDHAPTIEPKRGEWIPCSERLPSSSGKCLVTEGVERKTTSIGYFSAEYKRFYSAMDVIAWMPLPEPYCGADMREREGE